MNIPDHTQDILRISEYIMCMIIFIIKAKEDVFKKGECQGKTKRTHQYKTHKVSALFTCSNYL